VKSFEKLPDEKWTTLKELKSILSPLEEVTTWESGEKYVTLSASIPMLRQLKKDVAAVPVETSGAKAAKEQLARNLDFRFSGSASVLLSSRLTSARCVSQVLAAWCPSHASSTHATRLCPS
jgi:hypothetical protein